MFSTNRMLKFFLSVFGLSNSVRAEVNACIRIALLVANMLSISNGVLSFLGSRRKHAVAFLPNFSYLSGTLHDAAAYCWRLRTGDCRGRVIYRQSWHSCLACGIIVSVNVGIAISYSVFLCSNPPPTASYYDSRYWRTFSHVSEVCSVITQFQRLIVCLELAIILNDAAKEIECINLKRCSLPKLGKYCRKIEERCAFYSTKLWLPLTLMHVGYFLNLVTEIPIDIAQEGMNTSRVFYSCQNIKKGVELLIVVNGGNNIMEASKRLVRELRKRDDFFKDSMREVQLFTRSEHSISFGIGNLLTYKSCCCFLGLSWGFTLTVFQNSSENPDAELSRSGVAVGFVSDFNFRRP